MSRVFPGEVDEESRLQSGLPQLSERNPWLTGSLVHLLRLALMACGGYEKDNSIEQNVGTPDFRTFPFEDSDEVSLLSVLNASPTSSSVVKGAGDTQGRAASGGKQTGGSVIKVVCVRFTHPEEVQLLLVETVKTFSDFVSVMPLAVSKHASFCLQVFLITNFNFEACQLNSLGFVGLTIFLQACFAEEHCVGEYAQRNDQPTASQLHESGKAI